MKNKKKLVKLLDTGGNNEVIAVVPKQRCKKRKVDKK